MCPVVERLLVKKGIITNEDLLGEVKAVNEEQQGVVKSG